MALGIPLPESPDRALYNAASMGTSIYNTLMQQARAREQSRRLEAQNQRADKLQPYTIEHLIAQTQGLRGAESRASQMLPLQLQAVKDAHARAMRLADPNYEINQLKNLMNQFAPASQFIGSSQENPGMQSFIPSILSNNQQQNQMPPVAPTQNNSNIDMEQIKNNPILRGYFKKHFGIDLGAGESNVLHGPARDAADLAKLKKEVEAGRIEPEVYDNAKAAYDAQLDAKRDLRDLRARTKEGLKPGEKQFFDKTTGEPLGKEIPLTAKERESEEGNILFNELYPYVYQGAAPFSGEGSIRRLENAARNYKTDAKARKLFDDFLLADKMLAATTVNEAATLKAGKTNQSYNQLKESLSAQDIPSAVKNLIKQYQLPASAQLKAAMRYQQLLSDARKKARKSTPATQKLFYNPEMQSQHEARQEEGNLAPIANTVIVIDPNGNQFETTEENAAHLPAGWKRG